MTEREKMISGLYYDPMDEELFNARKNAQSLCYRINTLPPFDIEKRNELIKELFNMKGDFFMEQPIRCDYGFNVTIGKNFYSDYNLTILDCGKVEIGDDVLIAPNVSIYTATHPIDPIERCDKGGEYGYGIKIGNRVWIGGNSVILPGVEIGDETVIGAGSVVTKNVPNRCIVVGNPAKIIRKL